MRTFSLSETGLLFRYASGDRQPGVLFEFGNPALCLVSPLAPACGVAVVVVDQMTVFGA